MYAEEKEQAVNKAVQENEKNTSIEIATRMIKHGFSVDLIRSLVPALSENELTGLQKSLQKELTA